MSEPDSSAIPAAGVSPSAAAAASPAAATKDEHDDRSSFSKSKDYSSFRSCISQRMLLVRYQQQEYCWRLYDHGPKAVRTPLLLLPPVSGSADVWYQQMLPLACHGFRCIAVDYPVVDTMEELLELLAKLLQELEIEYVSCSHTPSPMAKPRGFKRAVGERGGCGGGIYCDGDYGTWRWSLRLWIGTVTS